MKNLLEPLYKLNDLPHVFANIPLLAQEILLVKETSGGLKILLTSGVILYVELDDQNKPREVYIDHASACECEEWE